jgi:hypothetical protein
MSRAQSELAARLGSEFGLKVIRLEWGQGLVFEDKEIVKIYVPRSKRILGCGPQERRVFGDLLCVIADELKSPAGRSKTFGCDKTIFAAPDANFPGLTLHSILSDGPMDTLFKVGLEKLFGALPRTKDGWLAELGDDYFEAKPLEQLGRGVRYLRGRLEALGEPFSKRPLPAGMTTEITGL